MDTLDDANVLTENGILKAAIKERNTTQVAIAEKLGWLPSAVSQNINRNRMTIEKFKEILDAMEYDIYVVDRRTGKAMWTMDVI